MNRMCDQLWQLYAEMGRVHALVLSLRSSLQIPPPEQGLRGSDGTVEGEYLRAYV